MHRTGFSVLLMLFALPAFADARLPVVNIAGSGVSARAAFGVAPVVERPIAAAGEKAPIAADAPVATATPAQTRTTRTVAARTATRTAPVAIDSGAHIAMNNDVLIPNRPSADLWAKNDMPLRMPDPSEFSVISANYDLPEESLNATASPRTFARSTEPVAASPRPVAKPMDEIDAQIARLVELQRRADDSVAQPMIAAAPAAPTPTRIVSAPRTAVSPAAPAPTADVKLSRMVVPMTPDVVVRTVEKNTSPRIAAVRDDMVKMSPTELRKAFRKTFLSENKHLSTFRIDNSFDVASDMSTSIEGFTAQRDLSETTDIRPLEIKIRFRNQDSALSRENYKLLNEYASIVVSNPKRAIQVAIPQNVATDMDARKLAARRLAIIEQVLRDTGVAEQRIMPVLSQRNEDGFVLRIISNDQYETLSQRQRDMFGDTVGSKTYKSMSW